MEIIKQPISTWKGRMINDFEKPACIKHTEIQNAINQLEDLGAVYSAMTGSGSTVFGLFDGDLEIPQTPNHWFVFKTQL
jgi:4-diphosphocytidyl-2-C-methyl-D-erythritol kinase